jgi:hypothetical protein
VDYFRVARKIVHAVEAWHPDLLGIAKRERLERFREGEGGKQPDNPSADGEPTAPTTPGGFGQVLDTPGPKETTATP